MVSRFPADISAPAWLTMAQYHWLNDTAVTFRSIVVAPDTRRKGDKPVNGARLVQSVAHSCPCSSRGQDEVACRVSSWTMLASCSAQVVQCYPLLRIRGVCY